MTEVFKVENTDWGNTPEKRCQLWIDIAQERQEEIVRLTNLLNGKVNSNEAEEKISYLHACYRDQKSPSYDLVEWFRSVIKGISA